MRKKITILIVLFTLLACGNNPADKDLHLTKDYLPRDMLHSGIIHNGKIYIPYPLQKHYGEIGVPYAIAEYDGDKIRFINDNPTNLCNKGNTTECGTFNEGWIEALIVTNNFIISVESSQSAGDYESYLTIRDLNGSNRKEIMELKTRGDILDNFQIESDNENIYFVFEDDIYQYIIQSEKLIILTKNKTMSDVENLKLEDDTLYFSVTQYEDDDTKYATSILSYNGSFNLIESNIEGFVRRVFSDKYFISLEYGKDENIEFKNFLKYYNSNESISLGNMAISGILALNDLVITLETNIENRDNILNLYTDKDQNLKKLYELKIDTDEWLLLSAIENNKILLSMSAIFDFGSFMEPITIEIKNDKLVNFKHYKYQPH